MVSAEQGTQEPVTVVLVWAYCGAYRGAGQRVPQGFDRIGEDVVVAEQAHQLHGREEGFELVVVVEPDRVVVAEASVDVDQLDDGAVVAG